MNLQGDQITDGRRRDLAVDQFPTEDRSRTLFHRRLEAWARTTPDAIALEFGDERLTYAEFNRRANILAHYLNARIPREGYRFVGLCLDRGPDMIVAVFAAFKAGCAFLPLDPSYPRQRLEYMLEDAKPAMVVSRKQLRSVIPEGLQTLDLDTFWSDTSLPSDNLDEEPDGTSAAYIIYTSGTTGLPKGVVIAQEGVSSMCDYKPGLLGLLKTDRVLQFASFNFDAIIAELVCAFSSGATLVTARREELLPGPSLTRLLRERAITMAILSPSVLAQIEGKDLTQLRLLISAGEACTKRIVKDWSAGRYFYNAYGPTEVTVAATTARLEDPAGVPTIGRALPDKTIHLLDEALNPVAATEAGEICIGGTGLAICYLNNPALTAAKFVYPPHLNGARVYRSGDLAKLLPDGNLEYMGRRDQQLKIRGFRVELGEIENVLCQHEQVGGAAILPSFDAAGKCRLIAYVLLRFPLLSSSADRGSLHDQTTVVTDPVLAGEIRTYAKKSLPDHMVPAQFVLLKNLPLTPNGKVDREALASIRPAPIHANPAAPESGTEKQVAIIWEQALCVEPIGRFDNFFDLGGDSLAMAEVGLALERDFGITIPQHLLYSARVLHHLARSIELLRCGEEDASLRQIKNIDLKAEAARIKDRKVPSKVSAESSSVFLTGATGFLGAFLLHRLLLHTKSDIFCLVRASNAERAKGRLREVLAKYGLAHPEFEARVWGIPGDISTRMFGFSREVFTRLSEMIGVIYHSAAVLDWIAPYDQIREPNVQGTQHVLELATQSEAIPVHYMSSIGVLISSDWRQEDRLHEQFALDDRPHHRMGYLQTKWVAERMVHHLRDEGLPIAVYRPPFITGDSVAGTYNTEHDFLAHKIKACLEMARAPHTGFGVNMTPVDFLADAIIHLATRTEWEGKVFHFSNPQPLDWTQWCDLLEASGYPLERVSYADWLDNIVQMGPRNPLFRMLPFLKDRGPHEDRTLYETFHGNPNIHQQQTLDGLRGTGIECPPTPALLEVYLPALVRAGFLPERRQARY